MLVEAPHLTESRQTWSVGQSPRPGPISNNEGQGQKPRVCSMMCLIPVLATVCRKEVDEFRAPAAVSLRSFGDRRARRCSVLYSPAGKVIAGMSVSWFGKQERML
jgi:hypothetical protein